MVLGVGFKIGSLMLRVQASGFGLREQVAGLCLGA